jgi:hypothetical protein
MICQPKDMANFKECQGKKVFVFKKCQPEKLPVFEKCQPERDFHKPLTNTTSLLYPKPNLNKIGKGWSDGMVALDNPPSCRVDLRLDY